MAKQYGFVDLEGVGRQVAGAALAAGIAGAAAGLDDLKDNLKGNAPVGQGKINPTGRITPGGRTKGSIGLAYPRVTVLRVGQFGGAADVTAQAVMAPQGIYHNDGVAVQRIAPKERKAMVFFGNNKWFAVGPTLRGGFTTARNKGAALAGMGTQFKQQSAVVRGAQPGSGWIDRTEFRPSLAAANTAWARIMRKSSRRASTADVPKRAFAYSQTPGAWGSGYRSSNDQKLRNNWRSAANRAGSVWRNQLAKALAILGR